MVKNKKHLFVEYECRECGYKHMMDHGAVEEVPSHFVETTCMNDETSCSKPLPNEDSTGPPNPPVKTSTVINTEQKKV